MPNWRISSSARSGAMSGGTHTGSRFITSATVSSDDVGAVGDEAEDRPVRHEADERAVALLDEDLADAVPVEQVGDELDRVVRGHGHEVGVVISCSTVTKLCCHCPPSSRLAAVHSATGDAAALAADHRRRQAVQPLPGAALVAHRVERRRGSTATRCSPECTRRSMTPR